MATQTISINVPLRITNYTIWSGGWEASVWYAITPTAGRVVAVTSMVFNNPGWTHFLNWNQPDERGKMQIVAGSYFPGIHMNANPTLQDNVILVMGWKNGGIRIDEQFLNITAVIEIPQPVQQMVESLGLNRSFEAAKKERLELEHPL